jgi:hypothetical protein
MPTYCKEGDEPIIKYRFQGDTKDRIHKSRIAPIDVTTKNTPIEGTENYSNDGFQITFYSPNNRSDITIIVRDYRIVDKGYTSLNFIYCGETKFRGDIYGEPSSIRINTSIKCPPPNSDRCSIEIAHKGIILFRDQGKCPVTFSVQCSKCPDGQHECKSNIYPYYCCTSCADTARKINNIANKMRR